MKRAEVTFRNLKSSRKLEQDIRERASKLENYCRDILACRVLLEVPHRHHEHGNCFEMRIDLTVPGEEIAVSRHHPNKKVELVVSGAFAAAKRQLQDYARRHRGAVKTHRARGPRAQASA
jgi:ribosome-associated translation inhibitor RaiA